MEEIEMDSCRERRKFKEQNICNDLDTSTGKKVNCHCYCNILSSSPVQSISRAARAVTKSEKLFWLAVFLVCLCGCVYEMFSFLAIFFKYPVLIDAEVKNNEVMTFPAVTVCNLNRMNKQYSLCLDAKQSWSECMTDWYRPKIQGLNEYPLYFTERKLMTSISKTATQLEKEYKLKSQEFLNNYTNLDKLSRKCFGYSLHELVKNCTFSSVACVASDFTYFQSKQYGNCFTFNTKTAVSKIGPDFGLELDLDVNLNTYMNITQNAGLRIVVHDPDDDPIPDVNGINISPEYETQISLTKTSTQRLPAPYRDGCKIYNFANYSSYHEGSQFGCIRQCMQHTNLEMCECINPFLPTIPQVIPCNIKNSSQMFCLDGVLEYLSENGLQCECPFPCISSSYDLQISTSLLLYERVNWGDSSIGLEVDPDCDIYKFMYNFQARKRSPGSRRKRSSDTSEKLESRAKLKIFYGSLDHAIFSQRAMFSDSELYGQLGGHLCLWLGLSFVALFECSEYLLLLPNLFISNQKFTHQLNGCRY